MYDAKCRLSGKQSKFVPNSGNVKFAVTYPMPVIDVGSKPKSRCRCDFPSESLRSLLLAFLPISAGSAGGGLSDLAANAKISNT